MILAAGLSPAWQQIVVLDSFRPGEVNRAREVHWCASGKVLNVGLALHRLRGTGSAPPGDLQSSASPASLTLTILGGTLLGPIDRQLTSLGVSHRWIRTESSTRICTTILDQKDGTTTELVENARSITPGELDEFCMTYRAEAAPADVVVLTGSLPVGTTPALYRDLLNRTSCPVILDAQGESLLEALTERPFVVKLNREELGKTLGRPITTDADLRRAMRELNDRGATWVVVTQGNLPVWISSATEYYVARPPTVAVVNPIGSGDCLAAGIAFGLVKGYDLPEAVLTGMAAAAENTRQLLPARINPESVAAIRQGLRFDRVKQK